MTDIGKKIAEDGVTMRWLRTAATTVTSFAAALAILWASTVWLIGPRVNEWGYGLVRTATEDLRVEINRTNGHLDRLDDVVDALEVNVEALGEAVTRSDAPSWRFSLPDTSISDGKIGGTVTINAGGYKLRECGVPRVDLYFINGSGVYHRFSDSTLLSDNNRGIAFPVDPDRIQVVSYRATIPANDGVMPGRAQGYISVVYPEGCPSVKEVVAGPLQFRINGEGLRNGRE